MKGSLLFLPVFVAASLVLVVFASVATAAPAAAAGPAEFNTAYSYNWAGYYVTGTGFTSVSASWTVPTVATTSTGYSSVWVGIGGVNGNGLVQIGTEQDCLSSGTTAGPSHGPDLVAKPSGGNPGHGGGGGGGGSRSCTPTYNAWWETYPANAEQPISGMTISPGDAISASISLSSGQWTLSISDATAGTSFTHKVTFTADQTTAEAIVERPALCTVRTCKLTNLADFGVVDITGASAGTSTGTYFNLISTATAIVMVDNGLKTMATPSSLSPGGEFTVTWVRGS